jgi:hypothetical protein
MNLKKLGKNLPALFGALLVAILFIQSGLDKVFDWRGNLEWLTGHFSKTFLRGTVPPMLATITLMELATGFLSAAGIVYFFVTVRQFDILRFDSRRGVNRRAFFRSARRQRLRGRGGFDSVFYSADRFDVSDESVLTTFCLLMRTLIS